MAVLSSSVSASALSLCGISNPRSTKKSPRKYSILISASSSSAHESQSATKTENYGASAKGPFVESPEFQYSYAPENPNGSHVVRFVQSTESNIEKVIFDFRFLALLAVGGSLAGSVLCFLNMCKRVKI